MPNILFNTDCHLYPIKYISYIDPRRHVYQFEYIYFIAISKKHEILINILIYIYFMKVEIIVCQREPIIKICVAVKVLNLPQHKLINIQETTTN